ncbi:MAG: S9 family peptidase [Candidatus Eisenbacteria bacterium]|uniref:S9 family peptidase n=1 Tax=Eiseniibacteriota bacterium TaxID=2212470 RepID=A0A7Y2H1Q0_UNCEI|nr:S9 family peptidase [Candidatus Eisenbacteria bacterium]
MTPKSKGRATKKRKITPEDINKFVFVGAPQVSPDGKQILFTRKHIGDKNNYVLNQWLVPTDGGDARQFTSSGKDAGGVWSEDGSEIAFIRSVEGVPQIFVMPTGGGEARALTKFPEGSIAEFKWSPDGKHLAVAYRETDPDWTKEAAKKRKETGASLPPRVLDDIWYRLDGDGYFNHQRFELYIVDTKDGSHRKVFDKDRLGFFSFDWSPDSKQLAIAADPSKKAIFESNTKIYLMNANSGKTKAVSGLPDGPKTNLQWSPDGKTLAYAGREGKDDLYSPQNLELWVCDPKKGKAKNLSGGEDYCLMAVAIADTSAATFGPTYTWSPNSKSLLVLLGWHGSSQVAQISASGGKFKFLTSGAYDHTFGNMSVRGGKLAMVMANATTLSEIGVGTVKGDKLEVKRLTQFNREFLNTLEIAPITSHWVTAADGHKVQVWVMRPPGKSKTAKVPAVLEVHGGPHAMYGVGFFHEFQVLAAAGYAVFFSNPRGSKGYGEDHTAAIKGAWGGADWVDVQAVIEFMKSQKWVNQKRMGIMGGSYGGYMTNWAIGHTNEFAGAITDRCVSNLVSMAGSSDFPIAEDRYWKGNFWDRPEALWEQSPIQYMGKVKTPTLIIHSEGDLRCNIEQSDQVFTLLKTKNVPTRYVRYPATTSHGMSRGGPPDLRIHRLHQILDWWKKYLA